MAHELDRPAYDPIQDLGSQVTRFEQRYAQLTAALDLDQVPDLLAQLEVPFLPPFRTDELTPAEAENYDKERAQVLAMVGVRLNTLVEVWNPRQVAEIFRDEPKKIRTASYATGDSRIAYVRHEMLGADQTWGHYPDLIDIIMVKP